MKWTIAACVAVAQVALAKSVHNVYPVNFDVRSPNRESNDRGDNNRGGVITNTVVEEETIIILWVNPGNGAATTTLATNAGVTATAVQNGQTASAVAPPGAAQTHNVTVGGPGGLAYSPNSITAAVGDTVIFEFLSQNHTVSQSAFATPCELLAGGMDTGFQPNPNNSVNPPPKVAMQVKTTTPLWFYCRQKGHCGKGMTFSINPTAEKTQAMFQSMAISQNGTNPPSAITGGNAPPPAAGAPPPPPPAAGSTGTASLPGSPAATEAAGAAASTGVVAGVGSLNGDGSCACTVLCAVGAFPAAAQGINAFGGVGGGALPMPTTTA